MPDYGFDALTNELYDALTQYPPDWERAEMCFANGANIHATVRAACPEDEENILAEIIKHYPHIDPPSREMTDEEFEAFWKQYDGKYLVPIIQFFLDHGFDVSLENSRYGADCLRNLTWSSYNAHILDATKLLLSAGASYDYIDEDNESVIAWVGTKANASCITEDDDFDSQLFCTMWDILDAHRRGLDYHKIDFCRKVEGKKISQVFTVIKTDQIDIPRLNTDLYAMLFNKPVFMICEGIPLRITPYSEIAVDYLSMKEYELTDISDNFKLILGEKINAILFPEYSVSRRGEPSATFILELSNGLQLKCCSCEKEETRCLALWLRQTEIS